MKMFGFLKRKMKRACEMVMPGNYAEMDVDDEWTLREQRSILYNASGTRSFDSEYQRGSLFPCLARDPIMVAFVANAVLDMTQNPVWLGSPPTDSISGCMSQPLWIPSPLGKQDLEDDSNSFDTP